MYCHFIDNSVFENCNGTKVGLLLLTGELDKLPPWLRALLQISTHPFSQNLK